MRAPNLNGIFITRGNFDRDTHTQREPQMQMEAETGVKRPQAKDTKDHQQSRRSEAEPPPHSQREATMPLAGLSFVAPKKTQDTLQPKQQSATAR